MTRPVGRAASPSGSSTFYVLLGRIISAILTAVGPGSPSDTGTLMRTVTKRLAGNHLRDREAAGPRPGPRRLLVFLKKQADFIAP